MIDSTTIQRYIPDICGQESDAKKFKMHCQGIAKKNAWRKWRFLLVPKTNHLILLAISAATSKKILNLINSQTLSRKKRQRLIKLGLVTNISKKLNTIAEIETVQHCNYRCLFCPVSESPHPKAFMTNEIFNLIFHRLKDYKKIKHVSINHYGEPTLDKNFCEKLDKLNTAGFSINLNTNASMLNKEQIKSIVKLQNKNTNTNLFIRINLPSMEKDVYREFTQSKLFIKVLRNLDNMYRLGVTNIQLAVNKPLSIDSHVKYFKENFPEWNIWITQWPTHSRAGNLKNFDSIKPVNFFESKLQCSWGLASFVITHDAKMVLCCNDYRKETILGDLRLNSIKEIENSAKYKKIKSYLIGEKKVPQNFICRKCSNATSISNFKPLSTKNITSDSFKKFNYAVLLI